MYILDNLQRSCLLREVSSEDLMKYRLSKKKGFVLKIKDQLFLAKAHRNSALSTKAFGSGLCKSCDQLCKGCPKVSDLTLSIHLGFGRDISDSVERYGRPEKYDFITFAVEVFDRNTSNCIIVECKNFREQNPDDYKPQEFAETIWTS